MNKKERLKAKVNDVKDTEMAKYDKIINIIDNPEKYTVLDIIDTIRETEGIYFDDDIIPIIQKKFKSSQLRNSTFYRQPNYICFKIIDKCDVLISTFRLNEVRINYHNVANKPIMTNLPLYTKLLVDCYEKIKPNDNGCIDIKKIKKVEREFYKYKRFHICKPYEFYNQAVEAYERVKTYDAYFEKDKCIYEYRTSLNKLIKQELQEDISDLIIQGFTIREF